MRHCWGCGLAEFVFVMGPFLFPGHRISQPNCDEEVHTNNLFDGDLSTQNESRYFDVFEVFDDISSEQTSHSCFGAFHEM